MNTLRAMEWHTSNVSTGRYENNISVNKPVCRKRSVVTNVPDEYVLTVPKTKFNAMHIAK